MSNTTATVKPSTTGPAEVDIEQGIQHVGSNQSLRDHSVRKVNHFKKLVADVREMMKGPMSEFFGMFIIIVFGCGYYPS